MSQFDSVGKKSTSTGTVTSVSGTANQIAVATGTTTPVLSFPSAVVFPGAVTKNGAGEALAASAAINTTETILVQSNGGSVGSACPAGRIVAGTRIKVTLTGTCTATGANASHFRIRIGTAGTVADTAAFDQTTTVSAATGSNIPFKVVLDMIVRTAGASATSYGTYSVLNQGVTGLSTANASVATATMTAFDTTAANFITVTYVSAATSGNTTCTFQIASIELPND